MPTNCFVVLAPDGNVVGASTYNYGGALSDEQNHPGVNALWPMRQLYTDSCDDASIQLDGAEANGYTLARGTVAVGDTVEELRLALQENEDQKTILRSLDPSLFDDPASYKTTLADRAEAVTVLAWMRANNHTLKDLQEAVKDSDRMDYIADWFSDGKDIMFQHDEPDDSEHMRFRVAEVSAGAGVAWKFDVLLVKNGFRDDDIRSGNNESLRDAIDAAQQEHEPDSTYRPLDNEPSSAHGPPDGCSHCSSRDIKVTEQVDTNATFCLCKSCGNAWEEK